MNVVTVNGKTYNLPNGNVSVIGNKVYLNGKLVEDCNEIKQKEITITIEGDNNTVSLEAGNITVKGNANDVSTKSGDIEVSGDANDVSTVSGDIEVFGNVRGNCRSVSGDVRVRGLKVDYNGPKEKDKDVLEQIDEEHKYTSWFDSIIKRIYLKRRVK